MPSITHYQIHQAWTRLLQGCGMEIYPEHALQSKDILLAFSRNTLEELLTHSHEHYRELALCTKAYREDELDCADFVVEFYALLSQLLDEGIT